MIRIRVWSIIAVLSLCVGVDSAKAAVGYVSSQFGEPWGANSNLVAMDAAFGAGNWNHLDFSTAVGALTPAYSYLYVDGGDGTDSEFVSFVAANQAALENWTAAGGCLFLNAATWNYADFPMGFGVTSYQAYDAGRETASAVNPLHPIFNGPYTPTGLAWSGNYFSHNDVAGAGFSSVIVDGFGRTILAERDWGSGHIMVGGMTPDYFHSPSPEAANLKANILAYGGDCGVPEPGTAALVVIGLLAASPIVGRRRLNRS